MRRVLPIVSLAGSRVRWGADEKRNLFTTLLNLRRAEGPASVMYNFAPDDVHDPMAYRLSCPFKRYGAFPEAPPREVYQAFAGTTRSSASCSTRTRPVASSARRAEPPENAENLVAMAQSFNVRNTALVAHLIALPDEEKTNRPLRGGTASAAAGRRGCRRPRRLYAATTTETNRRRSAHPALLNGGRPCRRATSPTSRRSATTLAPPRRRST